MQVTVNIRHGRSKCLSSPIPDDWICRDCGHLYKEHRSDTGCTHLMEKMGGPGLCRCGTFALPEAYLQHMFGGESEPECEIGGNSKAEAELAKARERLEQLSRQLEAANDIIEAFRGNFALSRYSHAHLSRVQTALDNAEDYAMAYPRSK